MNDGINSVAEMDKKGFTENPNGLQNQETTKTVVKPWGKEIWLALNDKYCYKRIYINAGTRTSYQYHEKKKETNFIISGEAEVWLENDAGVVEKFIARAGDFFDVVPPKKHRVIAITDLVLQEVSTPEVDDVIRIADDALRGDGRIHSEHLDEGLKAAEPIVQAQTPGVQTPTSTFSQDREQ